MLLLLGGIFDLDTLVKTYWFHGGLIERQIASEERRSAIFNDRLLGGFLWRYHHISSIC